MQHVDTFELQLRRLLNTWSRESTSNTPDYVLCQFMALSLDAFDTAVNQRDKWYGFKPFDANAATNGNALQRERDRLRSALNRAHAELNDVLNATPLDSPDGTASGFAYESEQQGPLKR